mgnify:CR=1 FL=1
MCHAAANQSCIEWQKGQNAKKHKIPKCTLDFLALKFIKLKMLFYNSFMRCRKQCHTSLYLYSPLISVTKYPHSPFLLVMWDCNYIKKQKQHLCLQRSIALSASFVFEAIKHNRNQEKLVVNLDFTLSV